jgi:glucoamylase
VSRNCRTASAVARAAAGLTLVLGVLAPSAWAADPALEAWIKTETDVAKKKLVKNTSPPDGADGAVVASPSREHPDYYYHWTRDAALTMDVVVVLSRSKDSYRACYLDTLKDYAAFSRQNQVVRPPAGSSATTGLGEPKFHVDGRTYDKAWGRPQNDGPALRAITLIRFAETLLEEGQEDYVATLYDGKLPASSVIKTDLEYVAHHWKDKDIDLWEETWGHHFYARMAQRRALLDGARLADRLQDGGAAQFYRQQAAELETAISEHWDPAKGYVVATREAAGSDKVSQLDACVVLAALHARSKHDGFFGPSDDRILATAKRLSDEFRTLYFINSVRATPDQRALQPGIGRYPEDRYNGYERTEHTEGNPWFLTTAAMAELCYCVAETWSGQQEIGVTARNRPFMESAVASASGPISLSDGEKIKKDDPRFDRILEGLVEFGDGYLRRVMAHADQTSGSLSEQFNRRTGLMQGAPNLTWSYGAVLTAFEQRAKARRKEPTPSETPVGMHWRDKADGARLCEARFGPSRPMRLIPFLFEETLP